VNMKKIILTALLLVSVAMFAPMAEAKTVSVKGYYKPSTGTYVAPSYRSSPNKSTYDNYSTKGNYNPYTGKTGTKNIYRY
jgi:hypothetical protein